MDFRYLSSDGTTTAYEAPESRVTGEESWWLPGSTAGVVVTPRTALQSSPILAAHITIAMDTGITPLQVRQEVDEDTQRVAKEHPLRPLLQRTPDGRRTPSRFRAAMMGHALGYKGGFAEIVRRGNGRPAKLILLDPRCIRDAYSESGRPGYWSGTGWIPADDMIHVSGFGFDGVNGYELTTLIGQGIGLTIGAESYAADYFANGADPGGVIELPGKFDTPEEAVTFRAGFEDRHQGRGKRHRVAVITKQGKWIESKTNPEQSQLVETRKYQATDSVRPWRVPPNKYGDFSQSHLANIGAANLDYLMTALMSWFVGIEEEFTLKLLSEKEWSQGYRLVHDLDALLRGDILTRFKAHEIAVRNGWESRNDVRKAEGKNPIPGEQGGDLYTVQQQVIPLHMAGKHIDPAQTKPGPGDPTEEPEPDEKETDQ